MNDLQVKYELLKKYGLHLRIDDMIMGRLTLEAFLVELNSKVSAEDIEKEFFNGISINNLDMLKGDKSELTPIIIERIKVYMRLNKDETVKRTIDRFTKNELYRKIIYRDYFGLGG